MQNLEAERELWCRTADMLKRRNHLLTIAANFKCHFPPFLERLLFCYISSQIASSSFHYVKIFCTCLLVEYYVKTFLKEKQGAFFGRDLFDSEQGFADQELVIP